MENTFEVAIVGAGFAGLGAGIRLKKEGQSRFVILERAAEIGGTWRDNHYPGCGCDVPSLLYSYSFELNPEWSRAFSRQAEILEYLKGCVEKYDLKKHIRYNTEIISTVFDQEKARWLLTDRSGTTYFARAIIIAVGPLNVPNIPSISGMDTFKGTHFHTSDWNHDYDFKGKRVAVIGTGASAIQLIPEIAKEVDQLYVFQRTAPWIIAKPDFKFGSFAHRMFRRFPFVQRFYRNLLYYILEFRGLGFFGYSPIRKFRELMVRSFIWRSVKDRELRKAVTPDYELGCKRILVSSDYYPCLQQDHVELIPEAVAGIKQNNVISKNGKGREVDAIVFSTGFIAADFVRELEIIGIDGRKLSEEWSKNGQEAYYGLTISGYPNLLFMTGPNTGLGHNSVIHIIESQLNYIAEYLRILHTSATSYLDLKAAVQHKFNNKIQEELSKMVWATGCNSWYQNEKGKNTTLWPGFTFTYRQQTRMVKPEDYVKKDV